VTESSAPLRATLKAGGGYEVPWITVEANNPDDLEQKLRGIIDSKVLETVAEAASMFQATQNATPLVTGGPRDQTLSQPQQAAPQQQSQGWGAAQQQAQAPQQNGGVQLHPEGKPCNCGAVLQYKVVNRKSDGKQFKFWACPNQRSRDDGHDTEFAN
jgi:hypothetical protein